jgi:hypothetical protein
VGRRCITMNTSLRRSRAPDAQANYVPSRSLVLCYQRAVSGGGAILRPGKASIFVPASWQETEENANGAGIVCIPVVGRL